MKFLLCSDLHLSADEKDYSLSVLNEIVTLCRKEKCGVLLFAGDVFDSWKDMEVLRNNFGHALESLPADCIVYFLPGNHEELRKPNQGKLESFEFGRARLLSSKPFSVQPLNAEVEILAIPFQKDYSGYRDWAVPPKEKQLRILLAHGTVPGIAYMGPGEESDSVLDEDMFTFFKADIAALGHLHGNYVMQKGATLIAYPGSARVWREGETDPRKIFICVTGTIPPVLEPAILHSAGEYRIVPIYVSPGGQLQIKGPQSISAADYVRLDVSGFVEDETGVTHALEKIKIELEKKCRKLAINKDRLSVLSGVSTHPLALRFLRKWEEAAANYASQRAEVYELARIKGLGILKEIMESHK